MIERNLPQETLTKAVLRGISDYTPDELKQSKCLLYISIGQPYHEGDKFLATMDAVNSTFGSCIIVVCDTLQRHTLRMADLSLSEEDAYNLSLKMGDEWLERNKVAL